MSTPQRLPYYTLSAEAYNGFTATKKALSKSSLGKALIELVWLRISQINGCAFCLEMHAKALRADGGALRGWTAWQAGGSANYLVNVNVPPSRGRSR
jgi:AhpD family alkylhydroperoxidase